MKASDIDWSKAPEWATGYGLIRATDVDVWVSDDCYTYVDGQQQGRVFSIGHTGCWSLDEIRVVSSRPSAWNGAGLPPVGTVCEYDASLDTGRPAWHTVEIVYSSEWLLVVRCVSVPDGYDEDGIGVEVPVPADEESESLFRPIRTPEQIAADERKRAIDAMQRIVSSGDPHYGRKVCETLYDAGYRRVEVEA